MLDLLVFRVQKATSLNFVVVVFVKNLLGKHKYPFVTMISHACFKFL